MKVVLAALNSKFIHSNLAIRYLKKYTEDLDYDCILKEYSINDNMDNVLYDIIKQRPKVIGFSVYIWNVEFVKKLSRLIRLVDEEITIFYGGPEISFNGEEYLKENYTDYIINGEGEQTYKEYIEALLNNYDMHNVRGILYLEKGNIVNTGNRENLDMNNVVFPYDNLDELENKIVYYEASRGCPFSCKYCLSSVDRNVRFLNLNRVLKELKFFVDNEVKLVKFVDRTFNINKEFSIGIWSYLIKLGGKTRFHFEISGDLLDEEEIALLKTAPKGLFQFEVGVQTTNPKILENINRSSDLIRLDSNICEIRSQGNISQHLDLIAGLPGEDIGSFITSFNHVYNLNIEEIQLGFLKVLKGSPMHSEHKEWKTVYSPYPPYEVLKTSTMSYEDINRLKRVEQVVDKYYNSHKFNLSIQYLLSRFQSSFELFYELGEFFYEKNYFTISLSNAGYYQALLQFYENKVGEDSHIFLQFIKFDYLKFNSKRGIPGFIRGEIEKKEKNEIKILYYKMPKNTNTKHVYIDKFTVDIEEYTNENLLVLDNIYVIFNQDNIDDIQFIKMNKI